MSALDEILARPCPVCNALADTPCRSTSGRVSAQPHVRRYEQWRDAVDVPPPVRPEWPPMATP